MKRHLLPVGIAVVLFATFAGTGRIMAAQQPATTAAEATIPSSALLQAPELVQLLLASNPPLILQVGSHVLYAEAHIAGAEYVGAAGTSQGLQALRDRVAHLKKDQPIVIYCGCCPWNRCPNIRPAYQQLESLGFTHVKALYLADNFGADWVNKGYPVAHGR